MVPFVFPGLGIYRISKNPATSGPCSLSLQLAKTRCNYKPPCHGCEAMAGFLKVCMDFESWDKERYH